MGEHGPNWTRPEERRSTRTPAGPPIIKTGPDDFDDLPFPIDKSPRAPHHDELSEAWHPLAKELFEAIKRDPAAMWISSAGWAIVRIECEALSRDLKPMYVGMTEGYYKEIYSDDPEITEPRREWVPPEPIIRYMPLKAASLSAHERIWAQLGLTEGARRRMNREVTLHDPSTEQVTDAGNVVALADRREALLTPRETKEA